MFRLDSGQSHVKESKGTVMADTVPARRPGPRRTLSEQAFLDAAQRLLSDGGARAVTIRAIAAQVGVAPNAVYTYFPNKAAVLRALVERLLGEMNLDELTDGRRPVRHRILSLTLQLRTQLLTHPEVVGLLLAGPMDGPNALALGEKLLDVLAEAGLGPDDAARASYLLTAYALGSIALEAAELNHSGTPPPEQERVATRLAGFAAVPAGDYPRTAAASTTMAKYISTDQFTWGLDRVLDGVLPPGRTSPYEGADGRAPRPERPGVGRDRT
jgi:TetR/AcrR family tetracycline transcriptional repressor